MVDRDVVRELARAKAALSALSGLHDDEPVVAHADAISARLGWATRLVARLEPRSGDTAKPMDEER